MTYPEVLLPFLGGDHRGRVAAECRGDIIHVRNPRANRLARTCGGKAAVIGAEGDIVDAARIGGEDG